MSARIEAKASIKVEFSISMTFTVEEAKALEAIAGYGTDEFLKEFYAKMGRHYLEPHEQGLRLLFERIRHVMPVELGKIKKAQESIIESTKGFR